MKMLLLLAAPLLAAVPASAQTYANWKSGDWSVSFDSGECWLMSLDDQDRLITVGVTASDPDFFVSAGQPGWEHAKAGERYEARVRFGAIDRSVPALGLAGNIKGVGTLSRGTANADLVELFKAPTLGVTFHGDSYTVDLNPTALVELRKCVVMMGGVG